MGQINTYTIVAGAIQTLRLDGGSRTVIRVIGNDVNISYQRDLLATGQTFTLLNGEAWILDANPLTGTTSKELGDLFYITVVAGASATVQVWLQGQTQGV